MSLCLCVSVFQNPFRGSYARSFLKHRGTENTEGSLPVSFRIPTPGFFPVRSLCLCVSVFQKTRGRWKHRGTEITEGSLPVSFKIPPRVSCRSNLGVSVSLCFKERADIGNTEAQRSRRGTFRCLLKFHHGFLSSLISVSLCLCVSKKAFVFPSFGPPVLPQTHIH